MSIGNQWTVENEPDWCVLVMNGERQLVTRFLTGFMKEIAHAHNAQVNALEQLALKTTESWTVQDADDGTHSINTGRFVLEMVTDDYQVAVDICDAHNSAFAKQQTDFQLACVHEEDMSEAQKSATVFREEIQDNE